MPFLRLGLAFICKVSKGDLLLASVGGREFVGHSILNNKETVKLENVSSLQHIAT